uniref:G_PROTEIN_RECEP_F2_4 domain-containing protein n=1 Tax=Rhabditophanes sp. KR3021 TaxID=114890 RepID=A0AC35U5Q6_9BILA
METTTQVTKTKNSLDVINNDKNITIDDVITIYDTNDIIKPVNTKLVEVPKTCYKTVSRDIEWPETQPGKIVRLDCPTGSSGKAVWTCALSTRWFPASGPDLSNCVSSWSSNLAQDYAHIDSSKAGKETNEAFYNILDELYRAILMPDSVYGGDLISVTEIITSFLNEVSHEDLDGVSMAMNKLSDIINVLLKKDAHYWNDLKMSIRSKVILNIIELYEKFLPKVLDEKSEQNVVKSTTILKPNFLAYSSDILLKESIQYPSSSNTNFSEYVKIPNSLPLNHNDKIVFVAYARTLAAIMSKVEDGNIDNLVSNIVSVSFASKTYMDINKVQENITDSMTVYLELAYPIEKGYLPECVYFNKEEKIWSTSVCTINMISKNEASCHCKSTGMVAVISREIPTIAYQPYEINQLQLLTMTSSVIGFIFLALTLFSIMVFAGEYEKDRARDAILRNMIVCLIMTKIVFLVMLGIPQVRVDSALCSIVTITLQYFILSFVMWMIVMNYQLHNEMLQNYDAPSCLKIFMYYFVGFVVPAITTFGACYGYQSINNWLIKEYCFTCKDVNFLISFAAPIVFALSINTLMALLFFCNVCKENSAGYRPCKQDLLQTVKNIKRSLKGNFIAGILSAATLASIMIWIETQNTVFCLLYCILNVLLAIFFFLYFVLFSPNMASSYDAWVIRNHWLPNCIQGTEGITKAKSSKFENQIGTTPVLFSEPFSNSVSPNHFNFAPSCVTTYTYSGEKSLLCSHYKSHITPQSSYQPLQRNLISPDGSTGPLNSSNCGTVYDYPTYNRQEGGSTFGATRTLRYHVKGNHFAYPDQHHHHQTLPRSNPPNFPPPPPPQTNGPSAIQYIYTHNPISDDSAYSDSGSSTLMHNQKADSNETSVIKDYSSGSIVLRMNLNKNPPVFANVI